jgi:hypothetical protein
MAAPAEMGTPEPGMVPRPEGTSLPRQFPSWPVYVLGVPIILRYVTFALALLVGSWSANPLRIIPAWAQILQSTCFASVAFVLLYYGWRDRRAWVLGLFILDTAAALLPFVRSIHPPGAMLQAALSTRTDAFQAALIWFFGTVFPKPAVGSRLASAFFWGTTVAFALGVTLVACDAYAVMSAGAPASPIGEFARALKRGTSGSGGWYFNLQFLWFAPLLVLMPLKLREAGPNDRRRFMWLALGIVIGFLPLVADAMLVTFFPQFGAPPNPPLLRLRGAGIVIALTLVPFVAAYAALVQRTLDVRLVLRRALQYLLARSFIWGLALAPFLALLIIVGLNRERAVVDLLSGPMGLTLGALTIAGLAAAFGRQRLMSAVDRRFFRQQVDARTLLLGVADASRKATTLDEVQEAVSTAIESVFHPSTMAIAVAGADDQLHALNIDLPPLARGSALALLLSGKNTPVDLGTTSAAIVERLSPSDRRWLRASHAVVLLPLLGAGGDLSGVLALGEKKSELPYDADDYRVLAAVGAPVGLALARVLAEARAEGPRTDAMGPDAPARECLDCGTVTDASAVTCTCGGLLQRALVPRVLEDRLRFDRRIGVGGMGVVYLATDLRLRQRRAVKTLPGADPVMIAGMRREARSMAAARHGNLATLHGLEIWHGQPMLVMEYLDGGTLAFRLRGGAMPIADVLALGTCLADALATLHERGVLHRDVKPSNIGYTFDGVPKLLDFGLAKLVPHVAAPSASTDPELEGLALTHSYSSSGAGVRGTPAYLSPEVLRGASPSARDDLWSLSVTLLEACTGANPFHAATIGATVSRVLADHERAAVAATLATEPQQLFKELLGPPDLRPKSARLFVQRLRLAL